MSLRGYKIKYTINSTIPVDILDFVPGEFGFKPTMSQGYNPETLLSVAFQNLRKLFRH